MKWLLTIMVAAVYLLHQDYWNWHDKTLVFGILPIGLAYHAGFTVLCAIMMWMLVKFAWPSQIEDSVAHLPDSPTAEGH